MYVHSYNIIYNHMYLELDTCHVTHDTGISAKTPSGVVTCKARMLMCSVDLPARAQLLNMKQFNGKQGCVYCEDEGTPRATSHLHRNWPYSSHPVQRSHAKMKDDARQAAENGQAVCYECGWDGHVCECACTCTCLCAHAFILCVLTSYL